MIILGIDTSKKEGSVTLKMFEGSTFKVKWAETFFFTAQQPQSEALIPAIQELHNQAGISLSQLDLITVVIGPGSFTGLRVGLAAAKGLSLALNKPLIGVSTFDLYAHTAAMISKTQLPYMLVALKNWRADYSCQLYDSSLNIIETKDSFYLENLSSYSLYTPLWVIGEELPDSLSFPSVKVGGLYPFIGSETALLIGYKAYLQDPTCGDPKKCHLFYLHPPIIKMQKS